jgi:hypothetical protein
MEVVYITTNLRAIQGGDTRITNCSKGCGAGEHQEKARRCFLHYSFVVRAAVPSHPAQPACETVSLAIPTAINLMLVQYN